MSCYRADLHIHTCLSPCADNSMTPGCIIEQSKKADLHMIAVCDHNSMENAGVVMALGAEYGITVLPGLEVCSREEVHMLALFDELSQAEEMQAYVYAHLEQENIPKIFGDQIVTGREGDITGENPKLLIGATTLGVGDIVDRVNLMGGIAIASHIDRPSFGIISQLGFIPPLMDLAGVEVSWRMAPIEAAGLPGAARFGCIASSDAHFPHDIGKVSTMLYMEEATVKEIRLALNGEANRAII